MFGRCHSLFVFHFKLVKIHKCQLRIGRGRAPRFSADKQQLRTVASRGEGVFFLSLSSPGSSPDLKGNYAKNPDGSECEGTTPHRVPCGRPVPPLGRVPPKMHRFIIPARGVLGFFQETCEGGCPQRPGLSPWGVEAASFYFSPVSGRGLLAPPQ